MVADPEHLIHGATGTGETVIMTSNKAIASYRQAPRRARGGLKDVSSASSAGGN